MFTVVSISFTQIVCFRTVALWLLLHAVSQGGIAEWGDLVQYYYFWHFYRILVK